MFCYVLKLTDDKWYIGKSSNPEVRIEDHKTGNGSEWTKLHSPLSVVEIIPIRDGLEEDLITKRYMRIYGIENVRGGTYTTIGLSSNVIKLLSKELQGADDKCYKCGQSGHFAKQCSPAACKRCGRNSHDDTNCYAKTHINGSTLDDTATVLVESIIDVSKTVEKCVIM